MTPEELLAAAYALDSPEANRALYKEWAATYDSGFIVESGYLYHEQVARVFVEHALPHLEPDDPIVDVGCGTGLAGWALRRLCANPIDGLDISPEMLGQAAQKQHDGVPVYRSLVEVDLTQPLSLPDGSYAGAVSVGTFTHGHVGPDALERVLRLLRPGGRAAIGVNAAHFASSGFAAVLDRLSADGSLAEVQFVDVPIYAGADMADPDQVGRVALVTRR